MNALCANPLGQKRSIGRHRHIARRDRRSHQNHLRPPPNRWWKRLHRHSGLADGPQSIRTNNPRTRLEGHDEFAGVESLPHRAQQSACTLDQQQVTTPRRSAEEREHLPLPQRTPLGPGGEDGGDRLSKMPGIDGIEGYRPTLGIVQSLSILTTTRTRGLYRTDRDAELTQMTRERSREDCFSDAGIRPRDEPNCRHDSRRLLAFRIRAQR